MPLNTAGPVIRMRLAILFLAITWLALTGLSSATVRLAVILRDRAKSDLVTSSDSILDITFQNLMDNQLSRLPSLTWPTSTWQVGVGWSAPRVRLINACWTKFPKRNFGP
jgi:hypothetical protein